MIGIRKEWLDKAITISLYAMIFALPFSKSMVEIFFIIALACWLAKRFIIYYSAAPRITLVRAFAPVNTELNLPIAVFVLMAFLSTICSVSLALSLKGFFFKLVEWVMIYFIVAEYIDTKERVNLILKVMIASSLLMVIDGAFQAITGTDLLVRFAIDGYRVRASFDSPNGFGAWIMVMLLLIFSLAYFPKNSKRPILWILVYLLIACMFLTYSRSVWTAAALSMILLGLFKSKKLVVIVLIALLAMSFIPSRYAKTRINAIVENSMMDDVRFTLWHEAASIIADFPVLGSGLNTYASVAPRYKLTEETGYYPHNSYLQMASDSGLLGVGSFLWILVVLFKTSLTNIKKISDKFYDTALSGLLAGLFGLLVHSFFDVDVYSLQLGNLIWFLMGLVIAVQKVALKEAIPPKF